MNAVTNRRIVLAFLGLLAGRNFGKVLVAFESPPVQDARE